MAIWLFMLPCSCRPVAVVKAIFIRALGLFSLNDCSRFVIACVWQSRKPSVGKSGMSQKRARRVFSSFIHFWKVKTGRERRDLLPNEGHMEDREFGFYYIIFHPLFGRSVSQ